jgi:acyl-CoA reductase-like NAD-dependent aldehyde dehydrogenase
MSSLATKSSSDQPNSPLMLIGGKLHASAKELSVIDPATGSPFINVPDCSKAQLDIAVEAARAAFGAWSQVSLTERQQAVKRMIARIRENAPEIAALLTREEGKPLAKAASEIEAALFFANSYTEMDLGPEVIRDSKAGRVEIHHKPIGWSALSPHGTIRFFYRSGNWRRRLLPVMRSSSSRRPFTPVATLRVGELIADIFPPGIVNIVSGGDDLGRWITAHEGINKVAFTGSIGTGKDVMRSAAANLKRVTLELGGNDAGIVLDDVDPSKIAEDLFWAAFSNCGQVCAGLKRLFVPAHMEEPIAKALADYAHTVKVGAGADDGVQIGPVQNKPQYDRVMNLLHDTKSSGAEIYFQGAVPKGSGYFVPVTLVRGARPGSRIVDEEPFGPVLPIFLTPR